MNTTSSTNSPGAPSQSPGQILADFKAFLNTPAGVSTINLENATVLQCIDERIKLRSRTNPRAGKQYFSLIKCLKDVETEFAATLMPIQINEVFWSIFIQYLQSQKKISASSVRTICSQLRAIILWASKYGAKVDPTYELMKLPVVSMSHVALTPDDISRIYHFDLDTIKVRPQHKRCLARVRDMFCLMCNLGLRYSDAKRIDQHHFDHNNICSILQQKTKSTARINVPQLCIHWDMTESILKKYNYTAPYSKDLTAFDRYLHELMEYCGFSELIVTEIVTDGVVTKTSNPKSQLITSHTARRSFVVFNALRGKPQLEIMKATGHKSFEAFHRYLCLS